MSKSKKANESTKSKSGVEAPSSIPSGKTVEANEAGELQAKGYVVVAVTRNDKGKKIYTLVPGKKD